MENGFYIFIGTLLALGVLVTFHEFGHFWVARKCGVKVLRFSVGFGTPLWRTTDRHGTEFVLAAIPLGGYVKMLDEREAPVPEALLDQAFNRKSVLQRIAIVLAGPLANFLLAICFYTGIALWGEQVVRPVIGAVAPHSLAQQAGLRAGDELIAIDGEAVKGWNDVNLQLIRRLGESGALQLRTRQAQQGLETDHSLVLNQWQKGVETPRLLESLGIEPWRPRLSTELAEFDPQGPAQAAGLRAGDLILAFDDHSISDWQGLVDWVRAHPDQSVRVRLLRDGLEQQVSVHLAARSETGKTLGYLGAGVRAPSWPANMLHEVRYGPFDAVLKGLERTWQVSRMTLDSLRKMVVGELSVKNLSGPVTIAKVAGASVQSGVVEFLGFLALLSISLGVLNLLPIPVLDGGHLLFYLIEWARGKPLPERVQMWGMQIGMALVLSVMLLALVNDLGRL